MRREWRTYLDGLTMGTRFHHRPDFRAAFPQAADWPLPLIAVEQDGQLAVLISAADFAGIVDLSQLMAEVDRRLPGAARLA